MSTRQLSDSAQMARAAQHLIENHGSRATSVALKRAAYLHQCGEDAGADTWRKIAELVQTTRGGQSPALPKPAADIAGSPTRQ